MDKDNDSEHRLNRQLFNQTKDEPPYYQSAQINPQTFEEKPYSNPSNAG